MDIIENKVFHDRQIDEAHRDRLFRTIFMPTMFMNSDAHGVSEAVSQWGLVYEYLSEAGPRSVDGYPIFLSMRIVHKDDMPTLIAIVEDFVNKRDEMLNPQPQPSSG